MNHPTGAPPRPAATASPPAQARAADLWGVQAFFFDPMVAFAYVAFCGLYGYRAGRKPAPRSANPT